ncbi:PREDICTED: uncharacterized protein LOC107103228 [Cyprinodon variegatus]|uniref:uncharacterized protein LOC107103228 n=1 Tax=Cyprinodon variegatus TaxID=28743 RepID=UPI000742C67D|nr:PREDICTED: uncharacterized protein LOC107103228 [Cyprinodon variegatus]
MLGWYLSLAPEDRRIILGEGGLQFFLQNHPNLEVLEDYVYLKYRLQQSETLKVFPGDFQNGANRSQLQLPEGVHSDPAVHLTGHGDPLTQNQSRLNSSTAATPLVMESDQSRQRGESGYWIHDPVAHHQSYASTLQTRAELQPPPPPPAGPTGGDLRREWEKSHSLINDDRSILMCLTSENLSMSDDKAPVQPVYDNSCNPPGVKRTAAASCCDAGLDSKPKSFTSISTQTEAPSSAEKSVMTVVLMSDLDCLSEELKRLQMPEECNEPKKKSQRAEDLPTETKNILQKLERDYKLLQQQLLMGVPLEQLSPLCVDPKVTPPGAGSSPAQVIGKDKACQTGLLVVVVTLTSNLFSLSPGQEVQRPGESGRHEERKSFQTQDESEEAADLANDGLIKQTASEEPGTDDIWFDAKEELNLQELAAENGPNSDVADNQS